MTNTKEVIAYTPHRTEITPIDSDKKAEIENAMKQFLSEDSYYENVITTTEELFSDEELPEKFKQKSEEVKTEEVKVEDLKPEDVKTEVVENKEPETEEVKTEENKEEKKTYTQEEVDALKKQAEKDAKKKYISQVSIKDAELKKVQAEYEVAIKSFENKEEGVSMKDLIDSALKTDQAKKELESEKIKEENDFFFRNEDVKGDARFVEYKDALLEKFPQMDLDTIKKVYMAENPTKFFKAEPIKNVEISTKTQTNTDNNKSLSLEEKRKLALEAFKKF